MVLSLNCREWAELSLILKCKGHKGKTSKEHLNMVNGAMLILLLLILVDIS